MDPFGFLDQELVNQPFLGATVYEWLKAIAFSLLLFAGITGLKRLLVWRFRRFSERTKNRIDDLIANLLRSTKLYFLIGISFYLGVLLAGMRDIDGQFDAVNFAERAAFLLFLLQVVRWGNTTITSEMEAYRARKLDEDAAAVTSMQAMAFLGRLALWAVAILLVLDNFGIDVTALVAGLGIGGIAVALAVQNILGDLFASLSIVLDKPFVVGDFLTLGEHAGTVERIGLKTTRIRSLSGEQIVISNGDLLGSRIRNYKRMYERRIVFTLGVTYQTPYDMLAAIPGMLREIVEAQEQTRFDRAHFKGFGDFALTYEVVYYVLTPEFSLYMDIQQAINLAIYQRFEEAGIVFAYPTQSLYVEAPVRTEIIPAEVRGNGQ